MTTHALRRFGVQNLSRWLTVAFFSGAFAVLIFHQGAAAMLHSAGLTQNAAFSMKAVGPWGLPQVWSLAFWGGYSQTEIAARTNTPLGTVKSRVRLGMTKLRERLVDER